MGNGMSDEKDGQVENSENGAKPVAGSDALSGRTRTAPLIEGQAIEIPAEETGVDPTAEAGATEKTEAAKPAPEASASEAAGAETGKQETEPSSPKRRGLRSLGAVAAVLALGAGGAYVWTEFGGALNDKMDISKETAQLRPATQTKPEPSAPEKAAASAEKQAETNPSPKKSDEASAASPDKEAKTAETAPAAAPGEKNEDKPQAAPASAASPTEPKAETPASATQPSGEMAKKADEAFAAKDAKAAEPALVAPPSEKTEDKPKQQGAAPGSSTPGGADAEKALTQMAAQLAATQSALEQVSQRLKSVETQLAAPKTDARAPLAARDSGPANTGDASARIVAAQSLLTALRQGDDYAPMLAALQNLGGDSGRLARLRADLAAPAAAKLAEDFAALAPKIVASVAPAAPPTTTEAKPPGGLGETVWAFLEVRLNKMVKIRPAGAPDQDATTARIDRVEKYLGRNDIAGALAERAQLPAPALSLTADWAAGAQARLDAEEAAKAELAAALQNLSKSKS
jgi:chemotaxis protein histidine kinase CheA